MQLVARRIESWRTSSAFEVVNVGRPIPLPGGPLLSFTSAGYTSVHAKCPASGVGALRLHYKKNGLPGISAMPRLQNVSTNRVELGKLTINHC